MQRRILWDLRDEIVDPFNETVHQVFARISAYRDALDGPQVLFIYPFYSCTSPSHYVHNAVAHSLVCHMRQHVCACARALRDAFQLGE